MICYTMSFYFVDEKDFFAKRSSTHHHPHPHNHHLCLTGHLYFHLYCYYHSVYCHHHLRDHNQLLHHYYLNPVVLEVAMVKIDASDGLRLHHVSFLRE